MIQNSSGKIYYGMHFYPGLAQYDQPNKESFKIYLNEDTLRKMDPTFAGKPVFVEHVDEVDSDLNELRKEADGWVVESFFNSADGKHWVKMIVVSDEAERAIKNGFRLSNAYMPSLNGKSGLWNGIEYQNEVVDGQYEHLAIVKNPRYEESIIMTPEEYKMYNENLSMELKRISNSEFKESDHPRAADGKFGSGGGSSESSKASKKSKSPEQEHAEYEAEGKEKTIKSKSSLVETFLKEESISPAYKKGIKETLELYKKGEATDDQLAHIIKAAGFPGTSELIKKSVKNDSNFKIKENSIMKLKFWNRKPVDNSIDFENLSVSLPRTGKEYTIYQIVNAMDEIEQKKKENMADSDMQVKLHDGKMCNVGELVEKYKDLHEKMENMKKKNEEMDTETDLEPETSDVDVEGDLHNEDEMEEAEEEENKKELKNKKMKNKEEDDEEAKKKALELAEHEEKEIEEEKMKNKKMKNEILMKKKQNFLSLKNAHLNAVSSEIRYDSMEDQLSRGKSRYGSN